MAFLGPACTVTRATYTRASDGSLVPMPRPPVTVGYEPVTCYEFRWGTVESWP